MIHLSQLGSTTTVDTTKLRDGELGQLLETIAIEAATRIQTKWEQLDSTKKEQIEFLTKCKILIQIVIPGHKSRTKGRNIQTIKAAVHSILRSSQGTAGPLGRVYHHRGSILWWAYLLWTSISADPPDSWANPSARKEVRPWRNNEECNTRPYCIGNNQLQKLEKQAHQWVQQALPSLDKLDTIFP